MRTRLLAASLTALAAVSLAACSSSGSGSASSSASNSNKVTAAAGSPTDAAATASGGATPGSTTPATTAPGTSAPADPSTPGTDGSAPAKPAPPADAGLPAKPDAGLTGKVVAALNAVDPAIVGGKPDQVVEQARKQCQAMYQFPKDSAKLVQLAEQHFTSPDHPQGFGPDTAAKINDALRATLCPPQR
ncbi:hypothetical protein ACIG0C_08550 [Kitasatospora aureofaciens]|uniref:hypothetical protein n=1 Tax=Kitasatospora aureofaciens TaxID=1894 RepID=UPI00067C1BAA|nr:hypothetical protein [Kitasatospora aureofaciens]ARF77816.1 hypothetical protein B6264_01740 [Kitasatospora aureofaciens]